MRGWEIELDPEVYYLPSYQEFALRIFPIIFLILLGLNIASFFVCFLFSASSFKRNGGQTFFQRWGLALFYNHIAFILFFMVVAIIYCSASFFSVQFYNVVEDYYVEAPNSPYFLALVAIDVVVGLVITFFVKRIGFFFAFLVGIAGGLIFHFSAGFLLYSVIFYFWMLLRFFYTIEGVTICAFMDIGPDLGLTAIITFLTPILMLGLCGALGSYYSSFASHVRVVHYGGLRYVLPNSSTQNDNGGETVTQTTQNEEEPIIITDEE